MAFKPVSRAALILLRIYKIVLSPLFGYRCRYLPSCSEYAADAIRAHGPWIGFWLALSRISRCHPFGGSGFDPVPEDRPPRGWRFWRHGDWAWTERDGGSRNGERAG